MVLERGEEIFDWPVELLREFLDRNRMLMASDLKYRQIYCSLINLLPIITFLCKVILS